MSLSSMAVEKPAHVARVKGFNIACIPKNGNSSIKLAIMSALRPGIDVEESRKHEDLNLCTVDKAPRDTIAFIRNPYARVLSAWADKLQKPEKSPGQANLLKLGYYRGMPFDEFVRHLPVCYTQDYHTMPQKWYVRDDFVLKDFTNLVPLWKRLMKKHRWLNPLSHERKTGLPLQEYYTAELCEIVERLYEEDFTLLDRFS